MTNPDETKENFYEDLNNVISSVPKQDKLIILGDFNTRFGQDNKTGVLASQGIWSSIGNGLLLFWTCTAHNRHITNSLHTIQPQKSTWMHPDSKHWHLIGYIIVKLRYKMMFVSQKPCAKRSV